MMSPKTIMRRFKGNLYAPLCNQFPTIACLHLCIFHTPHVSQCARLYHSGLSFTTAQFSQNLSEVGFEFLTARQVRPILVSYFIHMRLNINGSFDVKKTQSPFIEFIFFKINFFVFCTKKMDPLTIFTHWIKSDIAILGPHSSEKKKSW